MSQQISQQQQNFFLAVLNFFKPSNKIEIIDKHGYRFINLFISSQHFCVQVFI